MEINLHSLVRDHQNENVLFLFDQMNERMDSFTITNFINKKNSKKYNLIHTGNF